ncbi:hypothetical protein ACIREO_19440 [Streptomyces sp. NPDC102441]
MPLIETAEAVPLGAVCAPLGSCAPLLAVTSPRFHGPTGAPVKPLALV